MLTHCGLKILRNGFAPLNVYIFFMSWASSRRLSGFRVFFYTLSADLPLFVALTLVFFSLVFTGVLATSHSML